MVDYMLKSRGNGAFGFRQIRIFVNCEYQPLFLRHECDFIQSVLKAAVNRYADRIGTFAHIDRFGERFQILFRRSVQSRKKYCRFIPAEFIDQRSLAYASSSVDHDAFKLSFIIATVHCLQFFFTAIEHNITPQFAANRLTSR